VSRPVVFTRDILERIKRIERQLRDPRSANTAWVDLGLGSGWSLFAGSPAAGVMMTGEGIAMLRGSLVPGASGSTVATIPAEYCPEAVVRVPLAASGLAVAFAQINVSGTIIVNYTASPGWVALDGATWRAFTPSSGPSFGP
jgi:hypothetical protein